MSAQPISILNDTCLLDEQETTMIFFRFITNGLLINLFGFFGILGNIISMIILSRPQMKSSINYLLIGLARVDTTLIITSILLFGLTGIYPHTGYMFTYFYVIQPHIASALYFLATAGHTASAYLTVTVSFDRFVAVCNPLRARSLCTYGRARIYVLSVMVFSILYNIPKLWESRIYSDYHPDLNVTIYCVRMSDLRDNVFYKAIYVTWCYFIFMHLIPFLSLLVLNVCIYRQIRISNKERERLSTTQRREIEIAKMLICYVTVFLVCNILPIVLDIIENFMIPITIIAWDQMFHISNLLVVINSSLNFIIYVTLGEKYQRIFLQLFCSNRIFGNIVRDSSAKRNDSFISSGSRYRHRIKRDCNSSIKSNSTITIRLHGSVNEKTNSSNGLENCTYYSNGKLRREISTTPATHQICVSDAECEHTNTISTLV